ncbi:uncharacterized protein LOC123517299 [Portunus trituberculatus]|uniref:uncharacterized protein LOC123517299 n=1 Tax=Portunus trituberculatus TaxID=210409 RepID=UPI001E1CDC0A|nr:uncharacterized protein LOC123517299 [Portunus trituberculatus]XP_045133181.1 uncharacterized protein LOC123517299 [Portunus trituberculatus]
MQWTVLVWFCCLLVVSLAGEQAKEEKMKESDLTGRFIAKIKTRTRLIFTTDTTTVPYTCATFSSAVCRRRRRFQRQTIEDLEEKLDDSPVELFSGQELHDVPVEEKRKEKRLGITILGTVTTTTFTLTSTSTNSATTFSVSYFCSAPNVVFPPGC